MLVVVLHMHQITAASLKIQNTSQYKTKLSTLSFANTKGETRESASGGGEVVYWTGTGRGCLML